MQKLYNITEIKFDKDYLFLFIDNQHYKLKLTDISDKLARASKQERNEYKISPSGYGIHWPLLDEDLSINGLLKTHSEKNTSQHPAYK